MAAAGCGPQDEQARFEVSRADIVSRGSALEVHISQKLHLSRSAARAVRNGVALVLRLTVEVRDGRSLTLVAEEERAYEIRYLPMSEHFQLVDLDSGKSSTWPRMRHVLAELGSLRLSLDAAALAPGNYELRTRMRLDRASLPAPMQLPSFLSRAWRHDSDWTQWPFRINA